MIEVVAALAAVSQDAAYDSALALRRVGRHAEAAAAFGQLSVARPADPDVWLNLGLSELALGRYERADQALATVLRLAPAYQDARLAYARSAFFRGDRAEAERRLAPLLAAGAPDPEVAALQVRIAAPPEVPLKWRLDAYGAYSRLTKDLPSWRLAGAALGRSFNGGSSLTGAVEWSERFDIKDTYFELRGAGRLGAWSGYAAVGATPDADYRPEVAILAGATAPRLPAGAGSLEFALDAAWRRFPVGDVRTLQPSATVYLGRVALTGRWVNTWDERDQYRSGYNIQLGFAPTARLRLSGGWTAAPESSQGITVDVEALNLGAAYEINDRTAVRLDAVHEDRPGYDRDEVAIAFTRRF
jgi:YaiO family outer membrane protein